MRDNRRDVVFGISKNGYRYVSGDLIYFYSQTDRDPDTNEPLKKYGMIDGFTDDLEKIRVQKILPDDKTWGKWCEYIKPEDVICKFGIHSVHDYVGEHYDFKTHQTILTDHYTERIYVYDHNTHKIEQKRWTDYFKTETVKKEGEQ